MALPCRDNKQKKKTGEQEKEERDHQGPVTKLHSKPRNKTERKEYRIEKGRAQRQKIAGII